MGISLSGRTLANKYREEIKAFVQNRKAQGLTVPCIATILVGNDGGSQFYINNQIKLCEELGIKSKNFFLKEDIQENELIELIESLNGDAEVCGIMLQVPLPRHLNEKIVTSKILFTKDIDGLTDVNTGRFYKGENCFIPCTPKAIIELIKQTGLAIQGKHAVVIGRSNIVGKPVAQLLLNENATVTVCHSKSKNLIEICRSADILIAAVGRPGFVTVDFIKDGAVVIDVGTSMVDGRITGDICFDEVIEKASIVTPVPGGVGAMTTTMLLKNSCEALEGYVY